MPLSDISDLNHPCLLTPPCGYGFENVIDRCAAADSGYGADTVAGKVLAAVRTATIRNGATSSLWKRTSPPASASSTDSPYAERKRKNPTTCFD